MLLNQFSTTFHIDMSYSSATNGLFQQLTLIDLIKKTIKYQSVGFSFIQSIGK